MHVEDENIVFVRYIFSILHNIDNIQDRCYIRKYSKVQDMLFKQLWV